jgi:hypothetical protein
MTAAIIAIADIAQFTLIATTYLGAKWTSAKSTQSTRSRLKTHLH